MGSVRFDWFMLSFKGGQGKHMDIIILREALNYQPETGGFLWKKRPLHHFKNSHGMNIWNARNAGLPAGTTYSPSKESDYLRVRIVVNNKPIMAHQVAWRLVYGDIPDGLFIDHLDGDATNNSISNLRLVTHSENHRNRKIQSNNTSGTPGVRWISGKWRVRIKIQTKEISLGSFESKEQAVSVRKEYALKHGFTERHHDERKP